jgi:hypothetical protein
MKITTALERWRLSDAEPVMILRTQMRKFTIEDMSRKSKQVTAAAAESPVILTYHRKSAYALLSYETYSKHLRIFKKSARLLKKVRAWRKSTEILPLLESADIEPTPEWLALLEIDILEEELRLLKEDLHRTSRSVHESTKIPTPSESTDF